MMTSLKIPIADIAECDNKFKIPPLIHLCIMIYSHSRYHSLFLTLFIVFIELGLLVAGQRGLDDDIDAMFGYHDSFTFISSLQPSPHQ